MGGDSIPNHIISKNICILFLDRSQSFTSPGFTEEHFTTGEYLIIKELLATKELLAKYIDGYIQKPHENRWLLSPERDSSPKRDSFSPNNFLGGNKKKPSSPNPPRSTEEPLTTEEPLGTEEILEYSHGRDSFYPNNFLGGNKKPSMRGSVWISSGWEGESIIGSSIKDE